jgi:hypothetical protein
VRVEPATQSASRTRTSASTMKPQQHTHVFQVTRKAEKHWHFRAGSWHPGCSIEPCRAALAARLAAPVFRWSNRPTQKRLPGCREKSKDTPCPAMYCFTVAPRAERQAPGRENSRRSAALSPVACCLPIGTRIALYSGAARDAASALVFRWSNHPPYRPAIGHRESL